MQAILLILGMLLAAFSEMDFEEDNGEEEESDVHS